MDPSKRWVFFMGKHVDLTGWRFGRLTVLRVSDRPVVKGNRHWDCVCDCGADAPAISGFHLKSGHTASCGCLHLERTKEVKTQHGHAVKSGASLTYKTWAGMHKRCTNVTSINYERYGGRGISVCERWRDFANFLADMGERPFPDAEIDRIDNAGNYEPGNCRWVTAQQNARNRRSDRVIDTPAGKMRAFEAAELSGLDASVLLKRIDVLGWPPEKLFAPLRITRRTRARS